MKKQILETSDYDLFKRIPGNRPLNQAHIVNLMRSIEERNLLSENPIEVNKEMQVIDGQHRLEAAKALNLPIYYIVMEIGGTLEDVQRLNRYVKVWSAVDYLNSYTSLGKKEYLRLAEFAEEYRISVPIALRVMAGTARKSDDFMEEFRRGDFVVVDYKKSENLASLLSEIRKRTPDNCWCHISCVRALDILLEKINPRLLTDSLDQYQQVITRRVSIKDYLRQFENIINANKPEKQQVKLVDEK